MSLSFIGGFETSLKFVLVCSTAVCFLCLQNIFSQYFFCFSILLLYFVCRSRLYDSCSLSIVFHILLIIITRRRLTSSLSWTQLSYDFCCYYMCCPISYCCVCFAFSFVTISLKRRDPVYMSYKSTRAHDPLKTISLLIILDICYIMRRIATQRRCNLSKHYQQLLSFSSFPHYFHLLLYKGVV